MPYKWQLEKIAANRLKLWQDAKAEVERLEAINQQLLKACKNSWDAIASLEPDALGGVDPKSPTEEGYYIRDAILDDIAHAIQAAEGEL